MTTGTLVLGVDIDDGPGDEPCRLARCLRCDAWIPVPRPGPDAPVLPHPHALALPRRGKALRQAVIVRLISIERWIHCVVFGIVAVLAILVRSELAGIKSWVRDLLTRLTSNTNGTNALGGTYLVKEGNRLLALRSSTLTWVIVAALAYCIVEGLEAIGLWRERRWAEYLTVVETVAFIPYELYELSEGTSALKIGALVLNVVVLVYLVWAKRLFGLQRLRARREPPPPTAEDLYGHRIASAGNR